MRVERGQALDALLAEFDRNLRALLGGAQDVMAFCEGHGRAYFAHLMAHVADGGLDSVSLRARGDHELALHLELIERVVSLVCTDEEASQSEFIRCGRIAASEADRRIREMARRVASQAPA